LIRKEEETVIKIKRWSERRGDIYKTQVWIWRREAESISCNERQYKFAADGNICIYVGG